jgi:hypothetical protein
LSIAFKLSPTRKRENARRNRKVATLIWATLRQEAKGKFGLLSSHHYYQFEKQREPMIAHTDFDSTERGPREISFWMKAKEKPCYYVHCGGPRILVYSLNESVVKLATRTSGSQETLCIVLNRSQGERKEFLQVNDRVLRWTDLTL